MPYFRALPFLAGIFPGAQTVKNPPAMLENWVRSLGREDPLEEGLATPSSILAWRLPWTEEPGGPQSAGSQASDTTVWLNAAQPPLWEPLQRCPDLKFSLPESFLCIPGWQDWPKYKCDHVTSLATYGIKPKVSVWAQLSSQNTFIIIFTWFVQSLKFLEVYKM